MIDRLRKFEFESDKINGIIQGCRSLADTKLAGLCIDNYESNWKGYDGDLERSVLQGFRDELCEVTFGIYNETIDSNMNINTINNN